MINSSTFVVTPLLEKIIKKKLKKGKSTEQIADELEEDINIIQKVVEKLKSQI